VLRGHGVAPDVIGDIWCAVSGRFAQDPTTKQAVAAPHADYPYGYLGLDKEAFAKSRGEAIPPDLKESFNGGPLAAPAGVTDPDALAFCYQPTLWPDLPGFRSAWEAYCQAMEDLGARIMVAFAEALDLPSDYFDACIGAPISALRVLHYPATFGQPLDNQQRAGAHTDYGSLTILLPQPGSRGLEIRDQSGQWIEVPAEPGSFVINIGDLMTRWTSDRWVSTLHRVVARPISLRARVSRSFINRTGMLKSCRLTDRTVTPRSAPAPILWQDSARRGHEPT